MSGIITLNTSNIPRMYRHGFDTYKLYSAMNLHIRGSYDGTKYQFRKKVPVKWNHDNFPDKYIFNRIARDYSFEQQMVFFGRNLIDWNYIRDFGGDSGSRAFLESMGVIENSENRFRDLFNSYLIVLYNKQITFSESLKGQLPLIARGYSIGKVPVEFLLCLDSISPFLENAECLVYQDSFKRIWKYGKLFAINKSRIKEIISSCVAK